MANWTFEQRTGKLYDPQGNCVATGYAGGNEGKNPEGKNNPDMQDKPCIGPLPEGMYTLETPIMQSHLGPFAIPLEPDSGNTMFGRGYFYVHGDTIASPGSASEGCIIMDRTTRNMMWESSDHRLKVVRTYESKS